MRRLVFLVAICGLTFTTGAHATTPAADKASMDKRTRAFVGLLHGCQAAATLAVSIAQKSGGDLVEASGNVNKAKSICETVRRSMGTGNTLHFRDQAVTCEIAVDYYSKGLGRLSDYIDRALPSDGAKAVEYFGDASGGARACVRAVNGRRAVYGLKALPL